MPPEVTPDVSDVEKRLQLAGERARRPRGAGGALSARAAHDLRGRLLAAGSTVVGTPVEAEVETAAPVADEARLRVERRRWTRATTPSTALTGSDLPPAGDGVLQPAAIATHVLAPHVQRKGSSAGRFRPVRLLAAVVILAVLAGTVAYGTHLLRSKGALSASVVEATGASATRVGVVIPLTAGSILQVGDTVTVAAQGHAILALGSSVERLDGGSAMHLDRLDDTGAGVSQLAGRAYARVSTGDHRAFRVVTGPVTWSAGGTAFDIDREPVASGPHAGQELVTLIAIQDGVTATGPGFDTAVPQGDRAMVYIGAASPIVAPAQDQIPAALLLDPWLQANGALDQRAGLPLGVLEGKLQIALGSASPSPSPFVTPSPDVRASPSSSVIVTPSPLVNPTPAGTPTRTPNPTPTPSPTPTPAPTIGSLGLSATSCPGGVVLTWSKFNGSGFVRYVTLRAPVGNSIPAVYPPRQGYISVVANTANKGYLTAADTAGQASSYTYRTLVVGSNNQVLAASGEPTAGGAGQPQTLYMDQPQAVPLSNPTQTQFTWVPFSGPAACFSQYRVINTTTAKLIWAGGSSSTFGVTVTTPCSGMTFALEVLRITALGTITTGQSAPIACGS